MTVLFFSDKVIRVTPKDESELRIVSALEAHPTIKVSYLFILEDGQIVSQTVFSLEDGQTVFSFSSEIHLTLQKPIH